MLMCQSLRREYLSQVLPLEILGSHTDVHLLIMEIMYLVNVLVWREGNTNYLATWEPFKSSLMFRLLYSTLQRHFRWEILCRVAVLLPHVPQLCSHWCSLLARWGLFGGPISARGVTTVGCGSSQVCVRFLSDTAGVSEYSLLASYWKSGKIKAMTSVCYSHYFYQKLKTQNCTNLYKVNWLSQPKPWQGGIALRQNEEKRKKPAEVIKGWGLCA